MYLNLPDFDPISTVGGLMLISISRIHENNRWTDVHYWNIKREIIIFVRIKSAREKKTRIGRIHGISRIIERIDLSFNRGLMLSLDGHYSVLSLLSYWTDKQTIHHHTESSSLLLSFFRSSLFLSIHEITHGLLGTFRRVSEVNMR